MSEMPIINPNLPANHQDIDNIPLMKPDEIVYKEALRSKNKMLKDLYKIRKDKK